MNKIIGLLALVLAFSLNSCKNRSINEDERFRPRQVNDSFSNVDFSKVTIDGVEYLMMERDNNNPHEGFGFMAFRANKVIEKLDTILAMHKTSMFFQKKMYSKILEQSSSEVELEYKKVFNAFLNQENKELKSLNQTDLKSKKN